jgi:starch synthase
MGRQSAGEAFLHAMVENAKGRRLVGFGPFRSSGDVFQSDVSKLDPAAHSEWMRSDDLQGFSRIGAIHIPDPSLGDQAKIRLRAGSASYGITGITHTISSATAMRAIADLTFAPLMPWDGLICTSRSVKSAVEQILEVQDDYAKWKFGTQDRLLRPELPIIPLGVHLTNFSLADEDRTDARALLEVAEDEVAVLFLGRLSYHAKAHPFAMYCALEDVAREAGVRLVLIECGWFANLSIETAFKDGARRFSPSVRHIWLDGRKAEDRSRAWAAADIFLSLSDNIQETFGITVIEAMAAELPVVASDWDGYRDIVVTGETGFLVPTVTPEASIGDDLALSYAAGTLDYDRYIGSCSQLTSVNRRALRNAITSLVSDPSLRKQLGQAGRRRVVSQFSWSRLIIKYEELWEELRARRLKARVERKPQLRGSTPDQLAPFRLFSGYASQMLSQASQVRRTGASQSVQDLLNHPFFSLARDLLPDAGSELMNVLMSICVSETVSVLDLEGRLPIRPSKIRMALAVLAKMELIEVLP